MCIFMRVNDCVLCVRFVMHAVRSPSPVPRPPVPPPPSPFFPFLVYEHRARQHQQ